MTMRKLSALLVCALSVCLSLFALSGCGQSQDNASSAEGNQSVSENQEASEDQEISEEESSDDPVSVTLYDDDVSFTLFLSDFKVDGDSAVVTYGMTVTNEGDAVDSWSCQIPFNGKVSFEKGEHCTGNADGEMLTVSSDASNGNLGKGKTLDDVSFTVSGDANLAIFM